MSDSGLPTGSPDRDGWTRRRLLRSGVGVCALTVAPSILVACGSEEGGARESLENLKEAGVAKLGVAQVLPSAGVENGRAVGVFPEMAEVVLAELGIPKTEPVLGDFPSVIPSLQAGRIDLGCVGMYITPERCKAALFSNPPLCFLESLAVRADNPFNLRTYEDVATKGARVAVVTASYEFGLAEAAGVASDKISKYPDVVTMFDALKADRVDAVGYDNHTISYFVAKPAFAQFESTKPYAPEGISCGSFAFRRNATDFRDAFNREQDKLAARGAFDSILEKWATPPESIRTARGKKAQEFCGA